MKTRLETKNQIMTLPFAQIVRVDRALWRNEFGVADSQRSAEIVRADRPKLWRNENFAVQSCLSLDLGS